ncbi:hypothetical protein M8C21_026240 [Ambrosia artemisiifolia]|uniref:Uncharacterized protein n=1 Tax=Ambrosia artemisiifolia TaxID=4212 RepID=A0AAD5GKQ1_AMBAR|nr:hypothetical protein M8C21_026240 [Ambrosia artemisiifolia]
MMIGYASFMFFIFLAPAVAFMTDDDLVRLAGYGEEKLSTVVVSGALLCDDESHPIPGASVAVWCGTDRKSVIRGKTDKHGDFLIDLPSHLHAIPDMERRCHVRIVGVPNKSPCHRHRHRAKHTARIKLASSGNGIRTYSTHKIHLTRSHPLRGRKTHTSHVAINK